MVSFVHDEYPEWLKGFIERNKDTVASGDLLHRLRRGLAYCHDFVQQTPSCHKVK
ncbi:hypothetical protein JG688_00005568 [Phytophthora aleatoria]|uniref:Uncharacterized protein n=1 Tax=Phytophthora aleatoria TaxID=2496075 RepID=A0A8J5IMC5_9STRA|nr:hypothetical protein JG688_00005568 [Phytophthora aleatoria]